MNPLDPAFSVMPLPQACLAFFDPSILPFLVERVTNLFKHCTSYNIMYFESLKGTCSVIYIKVQMYERCADSLGKIRAIIF
jgi:hypothetical protein